MTKDAFKYVGGAYDNYNYLPTTGDIEVQRLHLADVEPATIVGTVADEKTGKPVEVTKKTTDDLSGLYFNSKVEVIAPKGYAIGTSDSLTDAEWAEKMVISANSEKVTSTYYLIDLKTGAITEMGTITTSVDTEAPVVASAFAADKVDSTNKTDLLNEKTETTDDKTEATTLRIAHGKSALFTTGDETGDENGNDVVATPDENGDKDDTEDPDFVPVVKVKDSVPAISALDGEYNSGVAKIQYYKVNGSAIAKSAKGDYTFDETKFETVDVTNIDKDNGYVTFKLSPDWTGYIVTRTVDKAGNYGDVRVASVKLENPPEESRPTPTPVVKNEPAPTPAPVVVNYKTGVGFGADIIVPVIVVVALIGVGAFVIVKKKKGDSEEKAAEKTEDKTEEKKQ